ncbi:transmembrane and immunoglobulin domain-containing protein 1-like [Osmerus mordax]|uniref:transmembrane and immunoglobulin domain-containing protein 1-like n=1 Tax=Osmerus mordax TaxID=8014 RepID=UPI00351057D2
MVSGPAISYSYLRLSANNISCTVECSVKNGRDVTLTLYKGEERLNQTSSPDLSSNISLHLEMKDQDGDTYSCVAENPISNQTAKLHKTELCPDTVSGPAISYSSLRLSANNVSCTLECSVKNGRDVTLSWYKGEERLYQTSSPDLSSNISLHLEMKDQDGDTYSCVAENPISNQTAKLHKTELCPGLPIPNNFSNHRWDFLVPGLLWLWLWLWL